MKNNNQKRRSRGRAGKNLPPVPATSLIRYTGRIPTSNSEDGVVVQLRALTQLFTGAAATTYSFTQTKDVTSYDNWSEYSTIFQEYRVLGIRYEFFPTKVVNTTAIEAGVQTHSVLHTTISPAITTLSDAISYGDVRVASTTKPWVATWKMTSTEEAAFIPVTTAYTDFTLTVFGNNLTINTTYGYILATALVQFRTTRK